MDRKTLLALGAILAATSGVACVQETDEPTENETNLKSDDRRVDDSLKDGLKDEKPTKGRSCTATMRPQDLQTNACTRGPLF